MLPATFLLRRHSTQLSKLCSLTTAFARSHATTTSAKAYQCLQGSPRFGRDVNRCDGTAMSSLKLVERYEQRGQWGHEHSNGKERTNLIWIGLAALSFVSLAAETQEECIESKTQIGFPRTLSIRSNDGREQSFSLISVGRRTFWGVFTTYAIGFYSDKAKTQSELRGISFDSNKEPEQSFYDQILSVGDRIDAAVRIVSPKSVAGKHLQGGFSSSIGSRLKTLAPPEDQEEASKALLTFVEMIPKELQKGTTIDIAWKKDGLLVSVDQSPAVLVKNSHLPKAFFAMYLDQKCVDQTLRKSLGSGIADFVVSSPKATN